MMRRCHNPKHKQFKDWGGRGITVCDEWHNMEAFLAWADETYIEGRSLDRIDNDGNYEPGNCRWATAKDQANNTRKNI